MSSRRWSNTQLDTRSRASACGVIWGALLWVVVCFMNPVTGATREASQPPRSDRSTDGGSQEADSPPSPDEQSQAPLFRSGINFVRVDAIVTDDDGNPVLDLTEDDFEIFEDDVPQQIESFKLVELTGLPDPALPPLSSIRNQYDQEREAAREDSRIFVFFLDDYHVRDVNAMRMTAPLVEFVETQLAPTDLVAIMYPLTPVGDVRLTRNHEQIVHALQEFEGRKYNYDPRNGYEHLYAHYDTTTVEMIRNDVSLSALKALVIHLGGLREGRKSAIVLSEGYTNYVPPPMRGFNALGGDLRNPLRFDPLAGEPGVAFDMVPAGQPLPRDADLIVIPGSKATLADLAFLRDQGWDIDIAAHRRHGGAVLGICAGFQMLGTRIGDPMGIEGPPGEAQGLGVLDVETVLGGNKRLVAVEGTDIATGEAVRGYEMHVGATTGAARDRPMLDLADYADGAVSADGRVMGCYVHGLFAADGFRRAFLAHLGHAASGEVGYEARIEAVLDGLADHLEAHMDVERCLAIAEGYRASSPATSTASAIPARR